MKEFIEAGWTPSGIAWQFGWGFIGVHFCRKLIDRFLDE